MSVGRAAPAPPKAAVEEIPGLTRYELHPPSWRAPWLSGVEASGYPQFYPTSEGQQEDQLTDNAIKLGFTSKTPVQTNTESFSAHQLIHDRLKSQDILPALARLTTAVAEAAQKRVASFGQPAFRLPSRVTLNEAKREAWINDLCNPAIPLSKLARNVPHGFRGEKLLDMVFARQAPLLRAIWYIRTLGAIEISQQKQRSSLYSVTQYSKEWTMTVCDFVNKQLSEITSPEPAALDVSTSSRTASKRVLADSELRATWASKFSYTLRLLNMMFEEHLVDQESFLRFLVSQVESSNIGQLPFVLFLVEEYLDDFILSEPLSARLVAVCFTRVSTLPTGLVRNPAIEETAATLNTIIRSTFVALPDAFVASQLWNSWGGQLRSLMLDAADSDPVLLETVKTDMEDIKARAEASSEGTHDADSVEPEELELIQVLDDVAFPVDLVASHKSLFLKRRRRRPLSSELHIFFTWSTTTERFGHHRPYAVAALLALELAHTSSSDRLDVEAAFIKWIDSGAAQDTEAVRSLLAELIRVGVLSYSLYLQRMIARGETEHSTKSITSLHLRLLRTVPLFENGSNALTKRQMSLKLHGEERTKRQTLVEEVQLELVHLIPGLTTDNYLPGPDARDCHNLLQSLRDLSADGGHLTITRTFIPHGLARILQNAIVTGASLSYEDHAILTQSFITVDDFWGLFQYLVLVLNSRPGRELLLHVLDVIEMHLDVWTALAGLPTLASALLVAHTGLKGTGSNERRLVGVLRLLAAAGHLEHSATNQLEQEYRTWLNSLATPRPQPQPLSVALPELHPSAFDPSHQAMTQLATTLWYRYHAYENWGHVVFEASLHLLSHVPATDVAFFLREINDRLPTGIEAQVARWIASMSPPGMVATFGGPLSAFLATLFSELVTEGTIAASSAVAQFILPAWKSILTQATATPNFVDPTTIAETQALQLHALETLTNIFSCLVGNEDVPMRNQAYSPVDLVRRQRAASRRASLYTHASLPDLGRCIAMLALQQELWTTKDNPEKAQATATLLLHVSSGPSFKMAVSRDPQALATSMLDSPSITSIPAAPAYRSKLLAALLFTLKDGTTASPTSLVSSEDWDMFLSGLTIWRLAISKVEVQAYLERLDLDTSLSDADRAEALNTLSRGFLDRVCSGKGHTYLGEQVVRCYHGRASDELVSVAFTRLAEAVDGLAESASPERRASALTNLRCTGRVLNTLLESGRASSRSLPLNQLLIAIKSCLDGLLESEAKPARETILHATHLLGIALRCTPTPLSSESCDLLRDCLMPLAKLAGTVSQGFSQTPEIGSLLLDTCAHILFTVTTVSPTIHLPSLNSLLATEIDVDINSLPDSVLSRYSRLFNQYSTVASHSNPWELVDHVELPSLMKDSKENRNSGPIDLALFDARVVELIPPVTALDVPQSPAGSTGHSERGLQTNFDFETPCTGLSLAARDHRRTLTGTKAMVSKFDPTKKKTVEVTIPDDSPPAPARGTKRKDTEVVVISDEEETAAPARGPAAKRGRGATAAKSTRGAARKKPKGS